MALPVSRTPEPWACAVVIPAHDEAELIGRSLGSVLRSLEVAVDAGWVRSDAAAVVVVVDSCRDMTSAIASQAIAATPGVQGRVVTCEARNVGRARRIGTDVAIEMLGGVQSQRCWLANTDADTIVPSSWLIRHLLAAESGVAALAGVVQVDSFAAHAAHVESAFVEAYELSPDGSHPHVHGANLGVRLDAYLAAGGWHDDALAEDHALWNRVRSLGRPMVSTTRSTVTTSGRRVGRAPGGFADSLRKLDVAPGRVDSGRSQVHVDGVA
ncbi:glycosyltransferase family 2 protein [soil metagenome]